MSKKNILIDTIIYIFTFIILFLIQTGDDYQLINTLFLSGIFIIFIALFQYIAYNGVFDIFGYSFSRLRKALKSKSYVDQKHEPNKRQQEINNTTVDRDFYAYKVEIAEKRKSPKITFRVILSVISIIIALILSAF